MSDARDVKQRCDLCGRTVRRLDRHHLIPRTRHKTRRNKRRFSRQEVHERTAMLCKPCHKMVHATLSEKELERDYNTLEVLRSHPEIAAFVAWVRSKRDDRTIRVRPTTRRREARKAKRR
ncbi:MAG: hypothetical protein ACOC7R_02630 [Planctomycetota bacterium]